jgi:hypothetical protein
VICGNYRSVQGLIVPRVQVLVWLDFPLWLVVSRVVRRTVCRLLTREPLWAGNGESVRRAFFCRNSIIFTTIEMHPHRRRQYADLFRSESLDHIERVRLCTPRQVEAWLRSFNPRLWINSPDPVA